MKKPIYSIKNLFLCSLLSSLTLGSSFAQTDSKKNAKKADLSTKEKVVATKDLVVAKIKVDGNGPKPDWAPQIKDEMLAVIEKLASYNSPDLTTLPAKEARKQPSPTTAVLDLIKENNVVLPESKVDTSGKEIPVKDGNIHLRIYTPKVGAGPFPVIVYYHGGGWVIANLDTYDASAKTISEQTGSVVVSVAYRQAPEFKFPVAHNDSYAAYEWVLKNAASIKGDSKNVALVGESAGGNLAASVSLMAKERGVQMPIHQVLVYPIASGDMNSESYTKYANAKPLNKPMMKWFFDNYLNNPSELKSKYINLVATDLKGMPSTTIITAQLDPLQSEGKLLAEKFNAAGVRTMYKNYDGVTHEFFGMGAILPSAMMAEMLASEQLKESFLKAKK
ncbi:MAG: alpha/beta hydrolase [Opitutaceae bacterium]|nr:alpha/beta hydrolase [Cytophagales bacterium]